MPKRDAPSEHAVVNHVRSRTRITDPGIYTLDRNIRQGGGTFISETCIRIESDDVILDGAGHTVDGRGVSDTTGIAATADDGLKNVVVMNLTVTDWDRGFLFENVSGGGLYNVRSSNNGYGLSIENTRGVLMAHNRITNNLLGVCFDAASDVVQWNNTVESNHGRNVYRRSDCDG